MTHWDYYDATFDWSDTGALVRPDLDSSRQQLIKAGMSTADAQRCVDAGFFFERHSGHIIDRYYGGALMPTDARTRFTIDSFSKLDWTPRSRLPIYRASSFDDVKRLVDAALRQSVKDVVFRGQIQNYCVQRAVNNPYLTVPHLGEISLVPSLWRQMLVTRRHSFPSFQSLAPLEWSLMLDSFFDKTDIERRMRAVAGEDLGFYNLFDFEECSDPVLQRYAQCQLDLIMGMSFNLAPLLATLLQHYGLLSPVLDLTSSLDVALFFATHKFMPGHPISQYRFVGTNAHQAVLYLVRKDQNEMPAYQSTERVVQTMFPLRPARQNCEICTSGPFALNLPADFLLGVIRLEFDAERPANALRSEVLFPTDGEDSFLRALKGLPEARLHLTDFV